MHHLEIEYKNLLYTQLCLQYSMLQVGEVQDLGLDLLREVFMLLHPSMMRPRIEPDTSSTE